MFGLDYQEEKQLHEKLTWGVIYTSVPIFVILFCILPSPWGKTSSKRSMFLGPLLPARTSWMVFESPNLVWSYLCWNDRRDDLGDVNLLLLGLFVLHYIRRAIVYPLTMSSNSKRLPLAVVLSGFSFCSVNGYLQARSLCQFHSLDDAPLYRVVIGLSLMVVGAAANVQSDEILKQLRKQSSSYRIPTGGLFSFVSAPHYLGEIVEWGGYSLACHTLTATSFWIFTMANLVPRAVAHHTWYQLRFGNAYPKERKAFIPFVW